ncbi:hypothetical protein CapIbe_017849 [Capra ibex]
MEGPRSPRSMRFIAPGNFCAPVGVTVLHFRDCPGVVLVGTTSPGFISGDFRHRPSRKPTLLSAGLRQPSPPPAWRWVVLLTVVFFRALALSECGFPKDRP